MPKCFPKKIRTGLPWRTVATAFPIKHRVLRLSCSAQGYFKQKVFRSRESPKTRKNLVYQPLRDTKMPNNTVHRRLSKFRRNNQMEDPHIVA